MGAHNGAPAKRIASRISCQQTSCDVTSNEMGVGVEFDAWKCSVRQTSDGTAVRRQSNSKNCAVHAETPHFDLQI
jgi:hypothetical protein